MNILLPETCEPKLLESAAFSFSVFVSHLKYTYISYWIKKPVKSQRKKSNIKGFFPNMLSKCFLILIFHFDLLSIQSWSQRFIPTTSACRDKYLCWLLAAFGNLFMASFYCTPKEIGSLCILGKKTPLSNHPYFCGLQSTPCGHLSAWEQRGFL